MGLAEAGQHGCFSSDGVGKKEDTSDGICYPICDMGRNWAGMSQVFD